MCLCFICINNEEGKEGYQVVIANNRDESFTRPTRTVHFWDTHCLSGIDDDPVKKGGTWLGVSTLGRIGVLLNILDPMENKSKKGRGFLVTNFLRSNLDFNHYCEDVTKEKDVYNKFNLVLLEKKSTSWKTACISNVGQGLPHTLGSGILAFGNSPYNKPWKKVESGRLKFNSIITEYNSVQKKDVLKKKLVELLSDKTSHWPDPQLMSQLENGSDKAMEYGTHLSSNFVDMSEIRQYGTRTHTIILIDQDGNGEYTEITLNDHATNAKDWKTTSIDFNMN